MKKTFLIITMNKYPEGDAGSIRQHSFAKLFQKIGYSVIVLGYGKYTRMKRMYDSIEYYSLRVKSNCKLIRLFNRLVTPIKTSYFLKSMKIPPSVIMVVDVLPQTFKIIESYAKKNKTLLIHDSVEWYSPEEFSNGKNNLEYKLKEYTNKIAIKSPWRVIAISSYLYYYFVDKGLKAIRVPVIMDIDNIEYVLKPNKETITFVYAGGPGRKDYLKNMIEGFSYLTEKELLNISIIIIGVTEDQLINNCLVSADCINKIEKSLKILGRVDLITANDYVKNADFSIILRNENLRYAKAGFPTKFVESLSVGTPVISNLYSDLGKYMEDRKNGIIVNGHTSKAFYDAVKEAIKLSYEQLEQMRVYSRATAEKYFNYIDYQNTIEEFIK